MESEKNTPREALPRDFFTLLKQNKEKFFFLTSEDKELFTPSRSGRDSSLELLKILKITQKDLRQFTEEQEAYFKQVMLRVAEGALPKQTINTALKALKKEASSGLPQSLKILALLQKNIPDDLLKEHISGNLVVIEGPREVILSEYLFGK